MSIPGGIRAPAQGCYVSRSILCIAEPSFWGHLYARVTIAENKARLWWTVNCTHGTLCREHQGPESEFRRWVKVSWLVEIRNFIFSRAEAPRFFAADARDAEIADIAGKTKKNRRANTQRP
jgi:hypothetical protein